MCCLTTLLSVMKGQQNSNDDIAMRAEVALDQKLEDLQIEQAELACPEIDESLYTNRGVIVNFFNPNTTGAVQNIGGVRLALDDIRKVPSYLHRNRRRFKQLAMKLLDAHLRHAVCPVGAGEVLTMDDYSLTFAVASLSDEAKLIWAGKRNEGPLYLCTGSNMTKPILWGQTPDGRDDYAHMVHAYVALSPAAQRRTTILKRLAEDCTPPPQLHPMDVRPQQPGNNYKRARNSNNVSNQNYNRPRPSHFPPNIPVVGERLANVERDLKTLIGLQHPSPPLPTTATPAWHNDGGNEGRNFPAE